MTGNDWKAQVGCPLLYPFTEMLISALVSAVCQDHGIHTQNCLCISLSGRPVLNNTMQVVPQDIQLETLICLTQCAQLVQ